LAATRRSALPDIQPGASTNSLSTCSSPTS
jgi:hypothetical protein